MFPFAAAAVVLLNAHALTLCPTHPEATALAVVDGRIVYVGGDAAAARRAGGGEAQVVDAGGLTVVPGFNDAHVHFGLSLTLGGNHAVDLAECEARSFREQVTHASAARPDDDWLFVKIRRLPAGIERASDLDFLTRPLFVVSSHGGLFNRAGLQRGGFAPDEAPHGFVRGRELAAALDRLVKALPLGRLESGARKFLAELAQDGLTSVQLIDELPELFEGLRRRHALTARIRLVPLGYRFDTRTYQPSWAGPEPEWVRVDGVKYFHDDGARISRFELAEIFEVNTKARRPVLVHVLSGRALDSLLAALESLARTATVPRATALFRVEHADEVSPAQARRLARLGMIVCSNPSMLPEWRSPSAFPMHTLLAAGVRTCIGTDWVGEHQPERSLKPIDSLALAVTHGGFGDAERITVDQALEAYTLGSAAAEGMAAAKGTLEVGKFADLVVLSADPRRARPEELARLEVLLTMVGGRVVYRSPRFDALAHSPSIGPPTPPAPPSIGRPPPPVPTTIGPVPPRPAR